jgi:hypothetical protein
MKNRGMFQDRLTQLLVTEIDTREEVCFARKVFEDVMKIVECHVEVLEILHR